MLNTGWINACQKAGLDGLHVHDLRHTVGLRLREAGVPQHTISDILWHQRSGSTIKAHYSQAQIVELREALELIREDRGQFNKTIQTLVREAKAAKKPAKKSLRSPTRRPMESPSKGPTAATKPAQAPSLLGPYRDA
jgi:integrase-like protein